ncbi:MAG: HAMP domain-containing sensor histidine kinase [Arcobacteraceae bacterium]
MVIDLTASEKSTFFRFVGLYLGSSFILMVLVTFFYYQNEKRLFTDLAKSNMQNFSSELSSKIIFSHMTDTDFDRKNLLNNTNYKLSFYNEKKEKIYGNIEKNLDFSKPIIEEKKHLILIDSSTLGHLGIYHIAVEEHMLFKKIKELQQNIFIGFILIYLVIASIGFYLAQLFLKPIKEERDKLNNFIKDTTHELNTPITALLMSTESDRLNPKQIQRVKLSARKISEIYNDLTYIVLEKHSSTKALEKIALDEIIKEQLNYFEPFFIKKQINILLDLQNFNYPIAKNDFVRLLNNIISNAIKYNNMGGDIKISLDTNGKLTLSDTGIGIQKEKLKDIFNRYFRATKEQGGFGIGLNIVRHVSTRYDIKIDVQSIYKKGTTFTFKF